jgi:hypothetical protein
MKKTSTELLRFGALLALLTPIFIHCSEEPEPTGEEEIAQPAALVPCTTGNDCESGQYCKIGAFKPGKADGHLYAGICAKKLEHQRVVGDPPNPSGSGGGGKICKGDFTLGFSNIHGDPKLGQPCWPREKPENCADGTWIHFPSAYKCYCIAKCATLGKAAGEWCDPLTQNFVCLHVIGDHAAADEAEVCVKPPWNLCTDGSEGELDLGTGTAGTTDETGDDGEADAADADAGDTTDGKDDGADGKDSGEATDGKDDGGDGKDGGEATDGDTGEADTTDGDADGKDTTTDGSDGE